MGTRFGIRFGLLLAGLLSAGSLAGAQDIESQERSYGRGVHAYYRGDSQRAHEELTRAIDTGSKDPRCFYFRALVYLRTGRPELAKTDLQSGAKFEAMDDAGVYPVDQSLQRIQGSARVMIQNHRLQARAQSDQQEQLRRQARYESLREIQASIVRRPVRVPLESLSDETGAPQVEVVTSPAPAIQQSEPPAANLPEAGSILEDDKDDALAGNPFGDDSGPVMEEPAIAEKPASAAIESGPAGGFDAAPGNVFGKAAPAGREAGGAMAGGAIGAAGDAMQKAAGFLKGMLGGMKPSGGPGGPMPAEGAGGFPAAAGDEENVFGIDAAAAAAMKENAAAPPANAAQAVESADADFGAFGAAPAKVVAPDEDARPVPAKMKANAFGSSSAVRGAQPNGGAQPNSKPAENPFGQAADRKALQPPKASAGLKPAGGFSSGASARGIQVAPQNAKPKPKAKPAEEEKSDEPMKENEETKDESDALFDE